MSKRSMWIEDNRTTTRSNPQRPPSLLTNPPPRTRDAIDRAPRSRSREQSLTGSPVAIQLPNDSILRRSSEDSISRHSRNPRDCAISRSGQGDPHHSSLTSVSPSKTYSNHRDAMLVVPWSQSFVDKDDLDRMSNGGANLTRETHRCPQSHRD